MAVLASMLRHVLLQWQQCVNEYSDISWRVYWRVDYLWVCIYDKLDWISIPNIDSIEINAAHILSPFIYQTSKLNDYMVKCFLKTANADKYVDKDSHINVLTSVSHSLMLAQYGDILEVQYFESLLHTSLCFDQHYDNYCNEYSNKC